jgi:hypothetical protein
MNLRAFSRLAISTVAVLLGFTTVAHAGPPLICHAIDIGDAKSLPSVEFNHTGSTDYDDCKRAPRIQRPRVTRTALRGSTSATWPRLTNNGWAKASPTPRPASTDTAG